jgi:glutamate-ammonia-ligase adenylyltransferase
VLEDFVYGAPVDVTATREMRERLEAESTTSGLKHGRGGTLDIEFLLAHLQMKHDVRQPGVWEALDELHAKGVVDAPDRDAIAGAYAFLRQTVNRMQILDGMSRHELPEGTALEVFARRMGYQGDLPAAQLTEELDWHRNNARRLYEKYV